MFTPDVHFVDHVCKTCDVAWRGPRNSKCWNCKGRGEPGIPEIKGASWSKSDGLWPYPDPQGPTS